MGEHTCEVSYMRINGEQAAKTTKVGVQHASPPMHACSPRGPAGTEEPVPPAPLLPASLAALLEDAGLGPGCFDAVPVPVDEVSQQQIHALVDKHIAVARSHRMHQTVRPAPLSPHTPKPVTYHEQSHHCRFMIGHSLGRYLLFPCHISVCMRWFTCMR